jgi:hypothetical protein
MDICDLITGVEALEGYRAIAERLIRRIDAGEEDVKPELVVTLDRVVELAAELRSSVDGHPTHRADARRADGWLLDA